MSVTLIGKNSHLARYLARHPATAGWNFLTHNEALQSAQQLRQSDVVLNMGFHPDIMQGRIDPETDSDARFAAMLKKSDTHYILFSTRLVYGAQNEPVVTVNSHLNPDTPYGAAKSAFEKNTAGILPPERLTILRQTNVMGFELGRKSTFGMIFNALAEKGEVTLTHDPYCPRDFMDVDTFCDVIAAIAARPRGGTYNIGIGQPTSLWETATSVAAGIGGKVRIADGAPTGQPGYYMRAQRIRDHFDIHIEPLDKVLARFTDYGRQLAIPRPR